MKSNDNGGIRPDYDVGYGKPPLKTRWSKGRSGNPSGRPRGSKAISTIFKDVLAAKVQIKVGGRMKKVSRLEASFLQLANKAANGDTKATRDLIILGERLGLAHESLSKEMPSLHVHFVSPEIKREAEASLESAAALDSVPEQT